MKRDEIKQLWDKYSIKNKGNVNDRIIDFNNFVFVINKIEQHFEPKKKDRKFPILDCEEYDNCPSYISWNFLMNYEKQIYYNHQQTLQRLSERGGLGVMEIYAAIFPIRSRDYKNDVEEALKLIRENLPKP